MVEQNPYVIKNRKLGIDLTAIDVRSRVPSAVYDQVVESAKIMQEDNDIPFSNGDVVFDPTAGEFLEVTQIFDNRHRDAIGKITLVCRHGKTISNHNATAVIHAGYLIQCALPYDTMPQVVSDNPTEIAEHILAALRSYKS